MRHSCIVAHPDDDLVFINPALLDALDTGCTLQLIYLTAGDAGRDADYWRQREQGMLAAYAAVTQASPAPQTDDAIKVGPATLHFLRLPDGMLDGQGSPAYQQASLPRLWNSPHTPTPRVDGQGTHTRASLLEHVAQLVADFAPHVVHTLNPQPLAEGEHPDHRYAGLVGREVHQQLPPSVRVLFYVGSNSPTFPPNVRGDALRRKRAMFGAYAAYDPEIPTEGSIYEPMLERHYVL